MLPLLLVAVVGIVVVMAFRYTLAAPSHVTLADVPQILGALQTAEDGSFAVLTLNVPGGAIRTVDLQLAKDQGRVGFDWVLCGESNEAEGERFLSFARAQGYAPELRELNDVCYYRIEQGDLAALCTLIGTKLYGRTQSEPVDLLVEGFEWTRG